MNADEFPNLFSKDKVKLAQDKMLDILNDRVASGISEFSPVIVLIGTTATSPFFATDKEDVLAVSESQKMLDRGEYEAFAAFSLAKMLSDNEFPYIIGSANDVWYLKKKYADMDDVGETLKGIIHDGGIRNNPMSVDAVVMQTLDIAAKNILTWVVEMDRDGNGDYRIVEVEEMDDASIVDQNKKIMEVFLRIKELIEHGD